MDTKKNFTLEITNAVQKLIGNGYSVSTKDVTKNNDLVLTGLIICKEGQNVCPTIYINQFYDSYIAGITVDTIATEIIRQYREHDSSFTFDSSFVTSYEKVKNSVIFQLVNTTLNTNMLKKIPSVSFLDFSIIFKILLNDSSSGYATATITNKMLDFWNVSTETVYKDALINTPILQEYSLKSMTDTLAELGLNIGIGDVIPKSAESDIMYILSNRQCLCGCGCILYPHVLEDFAKKIGMGFYILPSSRHEVLLIPEYGKDPYSLMQMVREVNRTQVEQEDFLSDNVYHYSKENKKITIIQ